MSELVAFNTHRSRNGRAVRARTAYREKVSDSILWHLDRLIFENEQDAGLICAFVEEVQAFIPLHRG